MPGVYEVLSEQIGSLASIQAEHHTRVYKELEALRESNLALHALVGRIDERQKAMGERLEVWANDSDARLDTHSERMDTHRDEALARLEALEKIEADRVSRRGLVKQAASLTAAVLGSALVILGIAKAVVEWGQ